ARAAGWAAASCTSSAPSSALSPSPITAPPPAPAACASTSSPCGTWTLCSRWAPPFGVGDNPPTHTPWGSGTHGGISGNNDFLRNTVHRHEPPVTAQPIQILAEDQEVVVVDKPSSLPVHPCGRFRHNTVIFILGKEHGLQELHTIHRLDRMTSGVLMFAKTVEVSKRIDEQVRERQVRKEYVCRVVGEFPEHEVVCEEPILVVSYKVGVCRVDPKGKFCKTIFQRLSYNGKSSVVKCLPHTGRTHQIRVHLQFLGHPIVNDPIYNMEAWGPDRGKGGEQVARGLKRVGRAAGAVLMLKRMSRGWGYNTLLGLCCLLVNQHFSVTHTAWHRRLCLSPPHNLGLLLIVHMDVSACTEHQQ
uniref:Pseudouridine synthase n=1 Tax=Amazona collaria TaxID=241587 RepID=A0A8B9G7W1_9PSIT